MLYAPIPDKNGISFSPRRKFTDYLDMWLETVKPTIALTTYKGYAKNVRRIKGFFKNYNLMLNEVKPIHIQNFYTFLYQEGMSSNSVIHIHTNLNKAFQYAVKNDLIPTNPMERVDRPKYHKYEAIFYNKDELNNLLDIFKDDRMELCVNIAVYYGLRRSEILGLKWDSIDFENKTITVFSLDLCNIRYTLLTGLIRLEVTLQQVIRFHCFTVWIYNKKVDKYDIIEDRKRRNKKCLQKRIQNTPRNLSKR